MINKNLFITIHIKKIFLLLFTVFFAVLSVCIYKKTAAVDVSEKGIPVPVIMYHSILKDPSRRGRYVISPTQLEEDFIYLESNGYTCIFIDDLINYVRNNTELPKKPIIMTFDDGHYNNKTYLLPLLEKYNQKAVISIVGKYTDDFSENPDENPNYAYLSWKNVNELLQSGRIEIGNHSYNMHSVGMRNGTHKMKGETAEAYASVLFSDLGKMQLLCREKLEITPAVFAYPFGSVSTESYTVLKECGFSASLSCEEGMNYITKDKDALYMLKRYIRTDKKSLQSILG